jgi:hypothetical protein
VTHSTLFAGSRRLLTTGIALGAIALGISACGSSSSSATGGTAAASSSNARYQARLTFAKCMRSHGVNVPDPSANGGPAAGFGGGGASGAGGGGAPGGGGAFRQLQSNPAFRTAFQTCGKNLAKGFGLGNVTAAQRQQFQQDAVKFAECMRAHNVDIPDPSSNGAGGFGIFRSISPSERNSPAFQAATKACASNLPRFGRGGGPPGAPSSST